MCTYSGIGTVPAVVAMAIPIFKFMSCHVIPVKCNPVSQEKVLLPDVLLM